MLDIRHFVDVLNMINQILRDNDIAEVKRERSGIAFLFLGVRLWQTIIMWLR